MATHTDEQLRRAAEVVGAAVAAGPALVDGPDPGRRRLTGARPAVSVAAMADSRPGPERRARALMGVVAASALVYPLLVCAVQLVFAQLLTVDVARDRAAGWPLGVALQRRASSPPSAGAPPGGSAAPGCCSACCRRRSSSSGWSGPSSRA